MSGGRRRAALGGSFAGGSFADVSFADVSFADLRPVGRLGLLITAILAGSLPLQAQPLVSTVEIVPPQEVSVPLALSASKALLCQARQLGVDVALRLESAAGDTLLRVDSPLDRRGVELLLFRSSTAQDVDLKLEPQEKGAPAGQVELSCEELPAEDRRLPAFESMSLAAATWAAGGSAKRLEALAEYGRAQELLAAALEPFLAAQALYSRAVLRRLAEDFGAATEDAVVSLAGWQALGDRGFEAAAANELGLLRLRQGDFVAAREDLGKAATISQELRDTFTLAAARANLCLLDLMQGAVRKGLSCSEEALPVIEQAQAPALELSTWVNVGRANDVLGEPEKALEAYSHAEALYEASGDEIGLARTLNNRGVLARQLGLYEQALDFYSRALKLFEKTGERRWRARALGNLGILFAELGDSERARQHLLRALSAWRELGDQAGESVALTQLGRHYDLAGDAALSAENYRLALAIDRGSGNKRAQGLSLAGLAGALAAGGSPGEALPLFKEALELLSAAGDRANPASILCKEGKAALAAGDFGLATAALGEALTLARTNGLRGDEVCAEKEQAELLARQGDLPAALERIETALGVAESLRRELVSPDLRANYSRIERETHERNVAFWMARHRAHPGSGFDAKALEMSERARARTFVELLAEARADLRGSNSPKKAALLSSALRRLAAKNERAQTASADEKTRLESEMLAIEREVDRLEAEIRRENPRWASIEQPSPLSAASIRAMLDPETVLLVYFLAEERSFLFRVDMESVEGFELAPRRTIEAAARRFYEELASPGQDSPASGLEVTRLILGPIADRIDGRRLVVVPDGALAYLPFGALPLSSGKGAGAAGALSAEALLEGRPVVHLPSIAALALLRSTPIPAERGERIAIFADPVYDAEDPRVKQATAKIPAEIPAEIAASASTSKPVGRGAEGEGEGKWPRLPGSRREAEMIAALNKGAYVATDFNASREHVLGDQLASFRIVHFATHGSIDAARPALSGLVLSTVDQKGKPIDGVLRLGDIYNLRLGADLVVLSGCRTALGEEIRGEGLVGISRGFFYAGARRVLASLWPVEDFATAALMQSFYRALGEGAQPEVALERAQQALRSQRRTRDPRAWAAFVLLGDWR